MSGENRDFWTPLPRLSGLNNRYFLEITIDVQFSKTPSAPPGKSDFINPLFCSKFRLLLSLCMGELSYLRVDLPLSILMSPSSLSNLVGAGLLFQDWLKDDMTYSYNTYK